MSGLSKVKMSALGHIQGGIIDQRDSRIELSGNGST